MDTVTEESYVEDLDTGDAEAYILPNACVRTWYHIATPNGLRKKQKNKE